MTVRMIRRGRGAAWLGVLVWASLSAAALAAGGGVLFVTSNPPGVEVLLDGASIGKTPVTLADVTAGQHAVSVQDVRFEDATKTVTVKAGEATSASFAMVAARSDFALRSDLVGLEVRIDGKPTGVIEPGKELAVTGLQTGSHVLALHGPFLDVERTFGIQKGKPTVLVLPGAGLAGGIEVATTVPSDGLTVNGVQVATGPGPYSVPNLRPGTYEVKVLTRPYPYTETLRVGAGEHGGFQLDAEKDLGDLVIGAVLDGQNAIRIDGQLVEIPALQRANVPPLILKGIVKGTHVVEIVGRPRTGELDAQEELRMSGRKIAYVPAGGTCTVDFGFDSLATGAGDGCPPGMALIPQGETEGEFWFKSWDVHGDPSHTPPLDSYRAMPLQGEPLRISQAGVNLELNAVTTNPAAFSGRTDLSTAPLSDHTSYYVGATAPQPYCIDIYEYPNRRGSKPVQMTYFDAAAACEREGKRLATSVEWVRACSGPQKQLFPYGDDYQAARCNTVDNPRSRGLAGAGSYAQCVNGYGLYDMSGNAAEWTVADLTYTLQEVTARDNSLLETPALLYQPAIKVTTHHEDGDAAKVDYRGGSWMSAGWEASCRAMPPVPGNFTGTDDRPSFIDQLISLWPSLDPEKELPLAQGLLQAFMSSWNEGKWRDTSAAGLRRGVERGKAGFVAALDLTAWTILEALGKGQDNGAGTLLGTSNAPTVDRSGAAARYLGGARLRGFRCASYPRGEKFYNQSASASGSVLEPADTSQQGTGGSTGGPGMMGGGPAAGGPGSMVGPPGRSGGSSGSGRAGSVPGSR